MPEPDDQGTSAGEPTVEECLAKIRATFPAIDRWKIRVASPTNERDAIEPEDSDWPSSPMSSLVRGCLAVAIDHLDAIRMTLDDNPHLFTYAQTTLARSALMGAANAVWVYAGKSEAVRIERARRLAVESISKQVKYYRAIRTQAPALIGPDFEDTVANCNARLSELVAKRDRDGQKARWSQTSVIEEAARVLGDEHDEWRASVIAAWQTTSADSHGLPWHRVSMAATAAYESGAVPVGASIERLFIAGDIREIAETHLGAYEMTKRGWAMHDALVSLSRERAT